MENTIKILEIIEKRLTAIEKHINLYPNPMPIPLNIRASLMSELKELFNKQGVNHVK